MFKTLDDYKKKDDKKDKKTANSYVGGDKRYIQFILITCVVV